MSEKEHINLPVLGMTCANCAVSVERALKRTEGVDEAMVNLSSERVAVTYDSDQTALTELVESIESAGYGVATGEAVLSIPELSDPVDAQRLEKSLIGKPGIISSQANPVAEKLNLVYVPTITNISEIMELVSKAGFTPTLTDRDLDDPESKARQRAIQQQRRLLTISSILTIPIFVLQMGSEFNLLPSVISQATWLNWVLFALATPVQFYVGRSYYINAWKSLRNGSANMDVLVALGTSVAYFYSVLVMLSVLPGMVYFETSATIITLVRLGKYLETKAKSGAGDSIKKLLSLKPTTARILRDGQETEIDSGDLVPGYLIVVRPGEKLPTDGIVVEGFSSIDESMLTGESKPIDKTPGSEVFGATLNKNGRLVFKATKVGRDTFLSQIIKMVEDAQTSKAPIQQLADKISAVFVPIVIAIAVLTFVIWYFVIPPPTQQTMHGTITPLANAIINTVAVLVIACPCAMGLATPTAVMTGTGRASELGILFKSGEGLEATGGVDTILFDKTGTLTVGRPQLTDILPLSTRYSEEQLLNLAASAESGSEHPLADAIVAEATLRNLSLQALDSFRNYPGKGIRANIDGQTVLVGNNRFIESQKVASSPEIAAKMEKLEAEAKTVVLIAIDGQIEGLFAITDALKPTSREAVAELEAAGLTTGMLTGDNQTTAEAIARQAGITEVHANLLPGDKTGIIQQEQDKGRKVAMVGDGINDAPALTQANSGIAIGTGTDVAIASASVVVISGDPLSISQAVRLSKRTLRTIRQNLFWAFIYNVILIPVAAAGLLHPMFAAGAMSLSSIFVVTNSLRLKNFEKDKQTNI